MTRKSVAAILAFGWALSFPANAAPRKNAKPAPAAVITSAEGGSLSIGPASQYDSPLVRAAKAAKAGRMRNAAEGIATAPMNEWMARSLGSLGPVPLVQPQSGALGARGIYDRRTLSSPSAPAPRSADAVRKDAARTSEQLLEYTPNDEEDGSAEQRARESVSSEGPFPPYGAVALLPGWDSVLAACD